MYMCMYILTYVHVYTRVTCIVLVLAAFHCMFSASANSQVVRLTWSSRLCKDQALRLLISTIYCFSCEWQAHAKCLVLSSCLVACITVLDIYIVQDVAQQKQLRNLRAFFNFDFVSVCRICCQVWVNMGMWARIALDLSFHIIIPVILLSIIRYSTRNKS